MEAEQKDFLFCLCGGKKQNQKNIQSIYLVLNILFLHKIMKCCCFLLRWLKMNGIDETSRKAMLASWLPFGGGPRICVGMRMAQIVFKSAIVHLIRTFELQCCPETEVYTFRRSLFLFKFTTHFAFF